jgi:Tfp pilus assembly PilM family ATPase
MSRLLALEWSETEARLVVGSLHGEEAVVEQAFSVPLSSAAGQPPSADAKTGAAAEATADVGRQIAAALAARGIRKIDTVVAIGRANIELRQLTLPPAPDDELPEMVRFQALREFNALQEDWPLDFIPIDEDPAQPRNVLAAAIAADLVGQIQHTCQTASLKLRRLVLRPCGAASLFCRRQAEGLPRARLLVDLLADEADLTVVIERKVIFLRTARLAGDPLTDAEARQAFFGELRRTMAAVHNQLAGRRVEAIVLCGAGPQHATLCQQIDERLGTPTELFDPFSGLRLESGLEQALPEHPSRFAPLLGILLDELTESAHSVDFLHPRRKAPPPSRKKQYLLGGLAAAVIAIVVGGYVWIRAGQYDDEIAERVEDLKSWDARAERAKKITKSVESIQKFIGADSVWLDEISWLSGKLPPAEETMLTSFVALANADKKTAEMKLEGFAKTAATLKTMAQDVGDASHRLSSKETVDSKAQSGYSIRFNASVEVGAEAKK